MKIFFLLSLLITFACLASFSLGQEDEGITVPIDAEFDEDEFEGGEQPFADDEKVEGVVGGPGSGGKDPQIMAKWGLKEDVLGGNSWIIESILISVLFIMVYVYYDGNRTNRSFATLWLVQFQGLFLKQFALVGTMKKHVDEKEDGNRPILIQESAHEYFLYASGRTNCDKMKVSLNLRQRHNLPHMIYDLFGTPRDLVTFEADISVKSDPFVLAICRKADEKKLRKTYLDLKNFGKASSSGMPSELICLTDSDSAARSVLGSEIVSKIEKNLEYFDYLHISDQYIAPDDIENFNAKPRRVIRMICRMPANPEDFFKMKMFMALTMHLMDRIANLALPQAELNRANEMRRLANQERDRAAHKSRQEAAEDRRAQKEKEERERIKTLPKEEQAKIREKRRKEEAKRMMPRTKMMKMKGGKGM